MNLSHPKNLLAAFMALGICVLSPTMANAQQPASVNVDWHKKGIVSKTVPTTQHLASAYTIRGVPLYNEVFQALEDLDTDYTRLQLWFPFPKLVVAELDPPTKTSTSWDFTYMDTMVEDFFKATHGPRRVINVGTIPAWMFVTPKPTTYPADPSVYDSNYNQGNQLVDPTGQQVADYFARVFSWYTQGGFTDENGVFHGSYHYYKFPIWQILNETPLEHGLTAQQYVTIYDATVAAIHKIDPTVQFSGPDHTNIADDANFNFVTYFLNPANHRPGTPIDWLTFHNYPIAGASPDAWENTLFGTEVSSYPGLGPTGMATDAYVAAVQRMVQVRNQLSPKTRISMDELGNFYTADGIFNANPNTPYSSIPARYWVASGAYWAFYEADVVKAPLRKNVLKFFGSFWP
jgi:hypothetical protein